MPMIFKTCNIALLFMFPMRNDRADCLDSLPRVIWIFTMDPCWESHGVKSSSESLRWTLGGSLMVLSLWTRPRLGFAYNTDFVTRMIRSDCPCSTKILCVCVCVLTGVCVDWCVCWLVCVCGPVCVCWLRMCIHWLRVKRKENPFTLFIHLETVLIYPIYSFRDSFNLPYLFI